MAEFPFSDGVAVVTGAASGIGAALAAELSRRGATLALVDKDAENLSRVAARLQGARAHVLDVAAPDAPERLLDAVAGRVNLFVNNAGVALGGRFEEVPEQDFDWLMAINFAAPVRLTRAFLPRLKQAPEARIVNVSSVFGLIAPPGQTAYSAAKFALRGFSEALREELRGSPVGVTVVHPGGVRTNIALSARRAPMPADELEAQKRRWDKALRLPPERAGQIIADGVARRASRILVGTDARVLDILQRVAPVAHAGWLRRLFGS